jgi:uncharacterized protein with FMN-binding domain
MRRTIITIGGTVAGLAALLAFKSHPVTDVSAVGTPGTSPSPTLAAGTGRADGTSSADGTGMAASATASASKPASAARRTVTGTAANTQEGPVQVQLVLTGKRITKVNILQRTDDGQESNQIDSFAIPKLTSETLTAQSARIDAVSGATYTSQGYIQSLQSALDHANA